jgi:hypothetical protein
MVAKKTSGAYSKAIDDETLKKILEVIESGPQTAAGIRNLLRPRIPDNVEISPSDVHNLRLRCLSLRVKGVKLASDEDRRSKQSREDSPPHTDLQLMQRSTLQSEVKAQKAA